MPIGASAIYFLCSSSSIFLTVGIALTLLTKSLIRCNRISLETSLSLTNILGSAGLVSKTMALESKQLTISSSASILFSRAKYVTARYKAPVSR